MINDVYDIPLNGPMFKFYEHDKSEIKEWLLMQGRHLVYVWPNFFNNKIVSHYMKLIEVDKELFLPDENGFISLRNDLGDAVKDKVNDFFEACKKSMNHPYYLKTIQDITDNLTIRPIMTSDIDSLIKANDNWFFDMQKKYDKTTLALNKAR